jgi:hypothetical protein
MTWFETPFIAVAARDSPDRLDAASDRSEVGKRPIMLLSLGSAGPVAWLSCLGFA